MAERAKNGFSHELHFWLQISQSVEYLTVSATVSAEARLRDELGISATSWKQCVNINIKEAGLEKELQSQVTTQ